jgi:CBS domain-containing protein
MKIKSIMTEEFETITPDASIENAAQLMKDNGVGALPVKNNGKVLGVVTDRDITIKAIADGMDPQHTPVKRIMSQELVYTNENSSIEDAVKSMKVHNIRRLLVLNDKQKLIGIVSLVPW